MFIQFTVRFLSKGPRLHRYIFPGYDTDLSVPCACERTKIYKWWVAIIIEHALRYGKTGNNKKRKTSWIAKLSVLPPTSTLSWLDKAKGCFHYPWEVEQLISGALNIVTKVVNLKYLELWEELFLRCWEGRAMRETGHQEELQSTAGTVHA